MFEQLLPNKNKIATVPNSKKIPTLNIQSLITKQGPRVPELEQDEPSRASICCASACIDFAAAFFDNYPSKQVAHLCAPWVLVVDCHILVARSISDSP
jgi:hypothetical protein